MKKKTAVLLLSAFILALITACGKTEDQSTETENIIMEDTGDNAGSGDPAAQEGDIAQENDAADVQDSEQAEENDQIEQTALAGEYTLHFYEYGEFLGDVPLEITETEFTMTDPADENNVLTHTYLVLADYLLALQEDNGAYTIGYYKTEGNEFTFNVLGITSESMVGSYSVFYTDQQSTADIVFQPDARAVEDNQIDVYGHDLSNPYEFLYCWYAPDADNLFLLVCIENGYFAYSVEFLEDGETLSLTEIGGYTYDLD